MINIQSSLFSSLTLDRSCINFITQSTIQRNSPDHGFFAHASSGAATGFDWYSADGEENVMDIEEDFMGGKGWTITSRVNAVDKLGKYNAQMRAGDVEKGKDSSSTESTKEPPKLATTTFVAPSLISLGRRQNNTAPSQFITGFWICPVGTGKSRFMSAAISKSPISIPRWLVHMNLNNFLDQDTFLLLGQHRAVLKQEAEGYLQNGDGPNNVRKSTYVYRSPSEKMGARIGQFFDATLSRVPNRKDALLAWYNRSNNDNKLFEAWPPRELILDRYNQHTKICPDSMGLVKNCDKVMRTSSVLGLGLLFVKICSNSMVQKTKRSLANPFSNELPTSLSALKHIAASVRSSLSPIINALIGCLLQHKTFYTCLSIALFSHWLASRVKREFYFKFNEDLHRKDVKYIANNWMDL
eukprot:scaffold1344_cov232-Alexandrium_tamarense.AAC.11